MSITITSSRATASTRMSRSLFSGRPASLLLLVVRTKAERRLCECQKRRRRKSISSALGPALMINEIASLHLFFSFRPSWSSSTPAYGTLLPWGRTMRKPLPVSLFFPIYFPCASLCRFRHSAKDFLSPDLATCGPFCFTEKRIFILLLNGSVLSCSAQLCASGMFIQRLI